MAGEVGRLYRLAAFAEADGGGNPAGVFVGDHLPERSEMQATAKDVGFSETAFLAPLSGSRRTIRYYSPEAEVSFCGHATIAAGVVLGRTDGEGTYQLSTAIGEVPVTVRPRDGRMEATLTSVPPRHETVAAAVQEAALQALGWQPDELDPSIPPAKAFAGAWHLVLAAASRERLDHLDYDFDTLKSLMLANDLTTLQLVWRETSDLFHARNPFPVGGIVEDPATGAAAAALGGYLRDAALVEAPFRLRIRQGGQMGRPSLLKVEVPATGGIRVSGTAIDIPGVGAEGPASAR